MSGHNCIGGMFSDAWILVVVITCCKERRGKQYWDEFQSLDERSLFTVNWSLMVMGWGGGLCLSDPSVSQGVPERRGSY